MTATDVLAIYGAILATALGAWDIAKYAFERRRLRVTCYVANLYTPGVGVTARNRIAYSIANTGGKPMVITTLGGALRSGRNFMFLPEDVHLPFTLQPGESVAVPGPMPEDINDVKHFLVHDALGKGWRSSTKIVKKQLEARVAKSA